MTITAPNLPDWPSLSTADRRAIFEPLWLAGKSAGEIARYFSNASRNAVIGAVARAKLKRSRNSNVPARNHVAPRKPRTPRVKPAIAIKPDRTKEQERTILLAEPSDTIRSRYIDENRPPIAGMKPISLMQLPFKDSGICRWPVIGGFCGAECGDNVYCETHRRYAYQARPE